MVIDNTSLVGERPGKPGRGSPNKVPFVAAVRLDAQGRPRFAKLAPVVGFTCAAIADWAPVALLPGTNVLSDGLGCFAGVIEAGCAPTHIVVRAREHFAFAKYAHAHLGAFAYRFDHRVHLRSLMTELLFELARTPPITKRKIRCTCAL